MMQLKEKQEKFCQNYILHKNATRAAKDAGYSDISAHNTGSRLLQDPLVQERLEELSLNMTTSLDVIDEIEKVLELMAQAFPDEIEDMEDDEESNEEEEEEELLR